MYSKSALSAPGQIRQASHRKQQVLSHVEYTTRE
jgi:hypothetical protein